MTNFYDISANVQIAAGTLVIAFLLLYIAYKVSEKNPSKSQR